MPLRAPRSPPHSTSSETTSATDRGLLPRHVGGGEAGSQRAGDGGPPTLDSEPSPAPGEQRSHPHRTAARDSFARPASDERRQGCARLTRSDRHHHRGLRSEPACSTRPHCAASTLFTSPPPCGSVTNSTASSPTTADSPKQRSHPHRTVAGDPVARPELIGNARAVLDSLDLIGVTTDVCERAGLLDPVSLRSLDAVHLAAALRIGDDLDGIVTYDRRLAEAAMQLGFTAVAPA